jgi:hypothetical protein
LSAAGCDGAGTSIASSTSAAAPLDPVALIAVVERPGVASAGGRTVSRAFPLAPSATETIVGSIVTHAALVPSASRT